MTRSTGYAAIGFEYDNSDNKVRESYYDKTGNLTWGRYGYSEIVYTYDAHNHCVEEHLLNTAHPQCVGWKPENSQGEAKVKARKAVPRTRDNDDGSTGHIAQGP